MKNPSVKVHKEKKIISKSEFLKLNTQFAKKMSSNKALQKKANDLIIEADKYRWIHQTKWLGEPLLNLPQDIFALQEIIWATKPDYVIEIGVAWGGGVLFDATLLNLYGGKKVIGIDIFLPNNLINRIKKNNKLSSLITLIQGSSIENRTLAKVKKIIGQSRKVLVILDSFHTHDHVLQELRAYSDLVGKNNYIICADTIIESIPTQKHRPRPWGPDNNPATAVNQFLLENNRFKIDKELENKLLFTCHPGGYLKAIK